MATPMPMAQFSLKLLYAQLLVRIPPPTADFSGQTVIVTGSNTGLGLEAARHLLRLKADKVILAVRDVSKGEAAAEALLKSTGVTTAAVEVWHLDLASYESVRNFAARASELERLDAVIQNAGMLTLKDWIIVNGMEAQLAVNVVHTTLLGLLLLPKLRESAKKHGSTGRMTFVSSETHYIAPVPEANARGPLLDALNNRDLAALEHRYATSKLLLFYAARAIAARSPITADSNVIVNAMSPGMCHSNLFRDKSTFVASIIRKIAFAILSRPTETGGGIQVDAVRPDLPAEAHGAYLQDCKIADNGPNVDSEKGKRLAERFTQELFEKLESIHPGVTEVLS